MTRVRLVLNGRFLGRPVTGVDRAALELTRAIRETLAAIGAGSELLEVALPPGPGGRTAALADAFGEPPHRIVGSSTGHRWEQSALRRYRPDAWLLNLCNTGPMLRRRQIVVIYDAQFVTQPHSYSLAFRAWYRILLSIVSRTTNLVFTSSEMSRSQLEQSGVVPRGKARVVRLGVDHMDRITGNPTVLERLSLSPNSYILAIGSLAPHKNLTRLVQAFVAARLRGLRLVIAGGGNSTVFRDAGLPATENVDYVGRVSDPDLKALYENALAFACPSISEGFGLPPLEAMSTGCPVVATTGGSVPEVCGDAALYADPLDIVAWSHALGRVANDPDLRARMAGRSRARARAFTWRGAARHLLMDVAIADDDTAMQAALARLPSDRH